MELAVFSLILLSLASAIFLVWLLWFLLFADADTLVSLAEKFGRPVSVYRGKVIWVTGASTGLGEAMAHELASVGAKLILSSRNESTLMQVKKRCLEISQGQLEDRDILVLPFDITNLDVHKNKFHDAINHFGKIDVLINNAGRGQIGFIADTDIEVDKEIFEVNFFGGVSLTKQVLKHFDSQGKGQIVVISSYTAKYGCPAIGSYSATKHALNGFYEALRFELCQRKIDITIVCPGYFKSEIVFKAMGSKRGEVMKNLIPCDNEMETSRCAHLTLVASANRLYEAWISFQPVLFTIWLAQYFPNVQKRVLCSVMTEEIIKEMNQGHFPNELPSWKPFFQRNCVSH